MSGANKVIQAMISDVFQDKSIHTKTLSFPFVFLDAIASLLLAGMYVTIWLKTHQFHSFSLRRLGLGMGIENGKWKMGNVGNGKCEKWEM